MRPIINNDHLHDMLWGIRRESWTEGNPVVFRTEEEADIRVAAAKDGKTYKVHRITPQHPWVRV